MRTSMSDCTRGTHIANPNVASGRRSVPALDHAYEQIRFRIEGVIADEDGGADAL